MKLLLIGHSVVDSITDKGKKKIQPGGMYYSAAAIASLKNERDDISLLTSISKSQSNLFEDIYNRFDLHYLNYIEDMPNVQLTIKANEEREEQYNLKIENLILPAEPLASFDGIYINMVTGSDISLDQLKLIRKKYAGKIYLDVHTLSRGFDAEMKRIFREIPFADQWASSVNILQLNEHELFTMSKAAEELSAAEELLSLGVELVIVTKAATGARVYFKNGTEISSVFTPALKVITRNKIGCGDVFGASFFYNYIEHRNIINALRFANLAAGFAASCAVPEDLKNLRQDVLSRYN